MRESIGIDSISGGPMPKPYSQDLRMRVIEAVEGGASRREAAELYGISPSVVVIWMQRWMATGSIEAKPIGGSTSPLDEHGEFLLGLTVEQPDMTLDEIVAAMARAGIAGSRTAVWRFYERHDIRAARERRRWMRQQGMFDPARLVFIDETCTNTSMVRLHGRCPRGERLIGYAPHGYWKTITFVAGLRHRAMVAPFVLEAMNSNALLLRSSAAISW